MRLLGISRKDRPVKDIFTKDATLTWNGGQDIYIKINCIALEERRPVRKFRTQIHCIDMNGLSPYNIRSIV